MSAFWMELILTIEAEPFDAFAVHPAGVAVYQLGNNGTARKLLKAWPVQTPEWPALKGLPRLLATAGPRGRRGRGSGGRGRAGVPLNVTHIRFHARRDRERQAQH
jgi:hypothetical protein